MSRNVLLTGGTGLVGADLIRRLLAGYPDVQITALVRGASVEEARARLVSAVELLEGHRLDAAQWQRVGVLCGDMTLDRCGLTSGQVAELRSTHVIHAASDVRFDLPLEEARRVNVGGTVGMLNIARTMREKGMLERFTYVSTAYVCGMRSGTIYEDDDAPPAFSNSYEQSKYESEQQVRAAMANLPASILRPSIIVGDARTGRTNAFKALYAPLRMLVRNLVRVLPCSENTPLDVVPVDYVSRAICHLLFDDGASIGRTLHLTAGGNACSTVGEIVRGAIRSGKDTGSAHVTFIQPEQFDPAQLKSATERALMTALAQFAPYLAINRSFDDSQTRCLLQGSGIHKAPLSSYLSTILRFAIESGWGSRFAAAA